MHAGPFKEEEQGKKKWEGLVMGDGLGINTFNNVYDLANQGMPSRDGTGTLPTAPAGYNAMFPGTPSFSGNSLTLHNLDFGNYSANTTGNPYAWAGLNTTNDTSTTNPVLAANDGSWIYPAGTVDDKGKVVLFDLREFENASLVLPNGEYPELPRPLNPTHDSHIDYETSTGQATYTFKPGDNPNFAAKDILASYPSNPQVPFNVMWRAVMETLDKLPNMSMKNEHDAENIAIGTQINVNQVLFEAAKLMESYNWNTKEAEKISPLPDASTVTVTEPEKEQKPNKAKKEQSEDSTKPVNPKPIADKSKSHSHVPHPKKNEREVVSMKPRLDQAAP